MSTPNPLAHEPKREPIAPTEAQFNLAAKLKQMPYSSVREHADLIAESEARRFAEWERQILQLETELANAKGSATKCPHVITEREGSAHCSLAERDGQASLKNGARLNWLEKRGNWEKLGADRFTFCTLREAIDMLMDEEAT